MQLHPDGKVENAHNSYSESMSSLMSLVCFNLFFFFDFLIYVGNMQSHSAAHIDTATLTKWSDIDRSEDRYMHLFI